MTPATILERSMVERVARAMALQENAARKASGFNYHGALDDWENLSETVRNMRRATARAAIEAMRDPTPEMVKLGSYGFEACRADHCPDAVRHIWADMIGAVLREAPTGDK